MAEQENQANDQPDLLKEMQASFKSWEADVATGSTPQPAGSRQK
jgi:hypothetical protein